MQTRDTVVQQIRLDMRNLVLAAAHVRDQPRADHLGRDASSSRPRTTCACRVDVNPTVTLNLLNALNAVLDGPQRADLDLGLVRDVSDEPLSRF